MYGKIIPLARRDLKQIPIQDIRFDIEHNETAIRIVNGIYYYLAYDETQAMKMAIDIANKPIETDCSGDSVYVICLQEDTLLTQSLGNMPAYYASSCYKVTYDQPVGKTVVTDFTDSVSQEFLKDGSLTLKTFMDKYNRGEIEDDEILVETEEFINQLNYINNLEKTKKDLYNKLKAEEKARKDAVSHFTYKIDDLNMVIKKLITETQVANSKPATNIKEYLRVRLT